MDPAPSGVGGCPREGEPHRADSCGLPVDVGAAMHLLKRPLTKAFGRLALAVSALSVSFGLAAGSASANPILYLEPTGPTTVPTVVSAGTSTYQLWVDPSVINAPGCTVQPPGSGLPTCVGTYGEDGNVVANGSLTMTAFSPITGAPAFALSNLQPCPVTINTIHYQNCSTVLLFIAGDAINGNATPFEIGTMTIANDGSGPGDVTLWSGDYLDANFNDLNATVPQTVAVAAVPEPGTLLLLGSGLTVLAVAGLRRLRA